jgi:hypothetical protein
LQKFGAFMAFSTLSKNDFHNSACVVCARIEPVTGNFGKGEVMRVTRVFFASVLLFAMVLSLRGIASAGAVPSGFTPTGVGTLPAPGGDPMFAYSFSGPNGLSGSGILDAVFDGNGTYSATGGSGTVVSPDYVGSMSLIPNVPSNNPNEIGSPSGAFIYDDQLLPAQNPLITNGGLLFSPTGPGPAGFSEINIFSNGPSSYVYYDNTPGGNTHPGNGYGYNAYPITNFTLTAIPIPKSLWGGLALLGAMGAFRIVRKQNESAFA